MKYRYVYIDIKVYHFFGMLIITWNLQKICPLKHSNISMDIYYALHQTENDTAFTTWVRCVQIMYSLCTNHRSRITTNNNNTIGFCYDCINVIHSITILLWNQLKRRWYNNMFPELTIKCHLFEDLSSSHPKMLNLFICMF